MKKNVLSIVIATSFFCFDAKAQSEVFVGMTVNSIVDNLSDRINEIVNNMDFMVSKNEFDIRQSLLIVTNNLDYILDKNINKTFEKLSETQRETLISINNVLSEFEKTSEKTLEKVEQIIDKANIFASSLPRGKRQPVITGITPSYYGNSFQRDVPVTIKGAFLSRGNPHITIDGIIYTTEKGTKIDNTLEFLLPLDQYNDSSKINLFSLKLTVYKKGFFRQKPVQYNIGIFLVPNQLGTYKLYTRMNEEERIISERKQDFRETNAHCKGARDVVWKFNSQSGSWKIDMNSINDRANISSKSSYNGLSNVTENGFRITGRVANNGDCITVRVPPFGRQTIARDGRGSINGTVSWKEYIIVEKTSDFKLTTEGNLYWGQDVSFILPNNFHSYKLVITQIDGTVKEITSSSNEKWYRVIHSTSNRDLLIKPRDLDSAIK